MKIFLIYSWDSKEHREWVRKLADSLEEYEELDVIWDGYDLDSLVDKNLFMESGIFESDFIVAVTTAEYKKKADARLNGVGIETYMASAVHWDGLAKEKKTKIIQLCREADSTPNYLRGHFYIDMLDDSQFQASLEKLIGHLRGTSKIPRPKKRKSLLIEEYTFTRVEDVIRINHKNRKAIISGAQGTDFSGSNRIKYEFWETASPGRSYFLAIADNINIAQTLKHAAIKIRGHKLHFNEMTLLRPRSGRTGQAQQLLKAAGLDVSLHEYVYKDYIWDYCIDDRQKSVAPPNEIANYTDQNLIGVQDSEDGALPSALEYVVALLQRTSAPAAHLIVASGGMGKTSLCLSAAARLHNRTDLRSSVVLIQAEALRNHIQDEALPFARIDSVFHLYELYVKFQKLDLAFDKNTFDLAVLCGNLIVIIDGLDEFTSMFQERFDLDAFLVSLQKFHAELGSSSVLMTTRDTALISQERLDELGIAKYGLLGFDNESCEKYIGKRFKGYPGAATIVAKTLAQIEKVRLQDGDGRIVPFFADIAATVVKDELRESRGQDFDLVDDPTPYPSNNELTDHIIHSVLRREETRHELNIDVIEVLDLFESLNTDFGSRWPAESIKERLQLLYDGRAEQLYAKLQLNPLLNQKNGDLELKYGFLSSYFEVLFVLSGLENKSLEKEFIIALGRMRAEAEFKEIRKFYLKNPTVYHENLSYLILSYLILSYLILSYLILSYLILSYLLPEIRVMALNKGGGKTISRVRATCDLQCIVNLFEYFHVIGDRSYGENT